MAEARPAAGAGGSGAWGLPRETGRKGCHAPAESVLTGESEPDRRRIEALPFKGRVGWGGVSVRTEMGRASCRERVCQYVYISVGGGSLKQKKTKKSRNSDGRK